MDFSRRRKISSHVETGSMNDIMFFLMLFFLIVSTMVNPNVIKLMLPKADKTSEQTIKKPVSISVNANGEYFVDKQPVAAENLEAALAQSLKGVDQPTVVLRVDASLNVQKLVDILEIGNKLKVKMVMATEADKGN